MFFRNNTKPNVWPPVYGKRIDVCSENILIKMLVVFPHGKERRWVKRGSIDLSRDCYCPRTDVLF